MAGMSYHHLPNGGMLALKAGSEGHPPVNPRPAGGNKAVSVTATAIQGDLIPRAILTHCPARRRAVVGALPCPTEPARSALHHRYHARRSAAGDGVQVIAVEIALGAPDHRAARSGSRCSKCWRGCAPKSSLRPKASRCRGRIRRCWVRFIWRRS